MLQMTWARQLTLLLGGSTYALTTTVFIVLVGIGTGGVIFHLWDRAERSAVYAMPVVMLLLSTFVLVGQWCIPDATHVVAVVKPLRYAPTFNALTCVAVGAVLELVPAVCMGCLFPYFVKAVRPLTYDDARAVGSVYMWNTAGALLGAVTTATILIPAYGSTWVVTAALAVYFVAIVLMTVTSVWSADAVTKCAFCIAVGATVLLSPMPHDSLLANYGMYMYGPMTPEHMSQVTPLFFREGASCNVLVTEFNGQRSLRVNGKVDASDVGDMDTQLGLAYFPRLFRPHCRRIMTIGFGSGTTCGASLAFPESRVVCCEIEPAVVEAAEHFERVNYSPTSSERFTVVYDDARRYLQSTDMQYDVIVSAPSNPWIAGVANLFTKEFYASVKARLQRDGVLAQWIQCYSLSLNEYALIIRTVRSVFPHCCLIRINDADTVLIASEEALTIESDTLDMLQSRVDSLPRVSAELVKYFGTKDVRGLLLQHYVLNTKGLVRLAGEGDANSLHTDINLRLEYDTPRQLFRTVAGPDATAISRAIVQAWDVKWFQNSFEKWGCGTAQLDSVKELVELLRKHGRDATTIVELGDVALGVDPNSPFFLAEKVVLTKPHAKRLAVIVGKIAKQSPEDASRVGVEFWRAKDYSRAVIAFRELIKREPHSATTWANLGVNYKALGRDQLADEATAKAYALDPVARFVINAHSASRRP